MLETAWQVCKYVVYRIHQPRQTGWFFAQTHSQNIPNHGHLHCRCFQRQFLIPQKNAYFIKTFDFTNLFFFTHTSTFLSQMYLILFPLIFSSAEKLTIIDTQQLDSKPGNPLKQCYLSVAAFTFSLRHNLNVETSPDKITTVSFVVCPNMHAFILASTDA